jgi:iron complex transport system substrate-binding protein
VLRPVALALLVAVVVTGCGFKHEPTGTIGPTYPVTIHDAAGRAIQVERQPTKILVLDPAGARILKALGAPTTLFAADAPVSQLRAAHPDLLIVPADTSSAQADSLAQRVGAPTYVLAGFQLVAIERGAAQLGLATGHALAGRDLALKLRAARQELTRRIASAKPQTVFVDTGFGYSIDRGDLLATLVRVAGGRLVGAGPPQPVSTRRLAALDPDVYAVEQSSKITLDVLRKRKGSKNLPAIRSGRLLVVDDRLVEPDQDAYRALAEIARFLHPEALS